MLPDHFVLFKHVVLDGLNSVAVLENARSDTLVEAGKVAKSHQGLKILQALAFSVQEKSNGSHLDIKVFRYSGSRL